MEKKKRILFISYDNPYTLDTGCRIYTSNILNSLKLLGYNIDVLCYDDNGEIKVDGITFDYIKHNKIPISRFLFSKKPGMVVNRESIEFKNLVLDKLKTNTYNYCFVNHFKMVFVANFITKHFPELSTCFISHNAECLLQKNNFTNTKSLFKKAVFFQNAIKTKLYEKKVLKNFNVISSISDSDLNYFKRYNALKNIVLRPVLQKHISTVSKKKIKAIIVGSFTWDVKKMNLEYFFDAKNIENLEKNKIQVDIIGNVDSSFKDKINSKFNFIRMHGRVEDLSTFYEEAKIAIIPELLGGGFKLKVAEAALNHSAIFAIKGAINEDCLSGGRDYFEFENFEDLIEGIIGHKNQIAVLDQKISNAYNIVKDEFGFDALKNKISNIVEGNEV